MWRSTAIVVAAPSLAACTPAVPDPTAREALLEAGASPAETAAPAAESDAPPPSELDPEIARAIEVRRQMGLRHDLAYVLRAATDPAARSKIVDFPMYPHEEAKFLADHEVQEDAIAMIQRYAERHEEAFGGLHIDREEHPGAVVSLWTGDLSVHETAIRERLPAGTPLLFRQVRYSEAYLRALQDAIQRDTSWMETAIPAAQQRLAIEIKENVVRLDVSSAEPRAVEQIEAHYDFGDALQVRSDGTGVRFIPWSTVVGAVLTPDGEPIGGSRFLLDSVSRMPGKCSGGSYGVRSDGTFELACQVGTRTIVVSFVDRFGEEAREIGRGSVDVVEGQTRRLTITLTKEP
jgi:hypothetical protein